MSTRALAVDALVGVGVGIGVLCSIALLVVRDAFDRLHYAMAATTVPPLVVAAAVLVEEGWNQSGINALVIAVAMAVANPVVAVATARAGRQRELGSVGPTAEELAQER